MRVTVVSAQYKKMVSDGNYGHEASEVTLTAELEDGENESEVVAALADRARSHVFGILEQSPSLRVRLGTHREERHCYHCQGAMADDEPGQLHAACREVRDAHDAQRRENEKKGLGWRTDAEVAEWAASASDRDEAEQDLEDLPV